jgi:predicted N-acetyltransferase YhbS
MDIRIRPITPADAAECGRIIYEAFAGIADRHRFPPDFPSAEMAQQLAGVFAETPTTFGVVAEADGRVVGSNFLTEHDPIRAVGPITVDPSVQGRGVGRRLMEAVVERGRGAAGIRLLQDAFNLASLSLYASLGFDVKEPLVLMAGRLDAEAEAGVEVRAMEPADRAACEELCRAVHGFGRGGDLEHLPPFGMPFVATRGGRVTAYASGPTFWPLNHAVAETEADLRSLLAGAAAATDEPLSFILPVRQASLFRWCLASGLKAVKPMTLMAMGEYREPRGVWTPSVGY